MPTIHYALRARDGLFFKDGRGWFSSESSMGRTLPWPFPSTLLGALRSAYGRHVEAATPGRVFSAADWRSVTQDISLSAMLPLRRPVHEPLARGHRMWPVPADALYVRGEKLVRVLDAVDPRRTHVSTLGSAADDEAVREALWRPELASGDKPEQPPDFWSDGEFLDWLSGRRVRKHNDEDKRPLRLPRRTIIRLAMDPETQAARQGMLYATEILETLAAGDAAPWEWTIACKGELPTQADLSGTSWILGGDSKLAQAEVLSEEFFSAPGAMLAAFDKGSPGLRLVVVTPAHFKAGWLPDEVHVHGGEYRGQLHGVDVVLRAALVPRPLHMSGWDLAEGKPKDTRRLVRPGAVYFFQKAQPGATFSRKEAEKLWLAALGQDTAEGLGCVVPGVWFPKNA